MKRHLGYFLVFVFIVLGSSLMAFAQYGEDAPVISNVKISDVENGSATIEWSTDVESDATINYCLNSDYGIVRYPLYDKKDHKIKIDDLEPLTTYHFRVVSSDEFGNKSTSAGFVFTTKGSQDIEGIEEVEDPEERLLVEKILEYLDEVESLEALKLILEKIDNVTEEIVPPPSIISVPEVKVDTYYADISWKTDRETRSKVYFAKEEDYDPFSQDPYNFSQEAVSGLTTDHEVSIIGLEPSTTYHFKVSSEDEFGLIGESPDNTFTTKSLLPEIGNIRILKVQETSATIAWTTDVIASGIVEFTNLRRGDSRSAGDPSFTTSHSVQLNDLEFGTRYSVVIKANNPSGEEVVSEPFTFITVRDEAPPIISKVSNESTLFPGADTKIQTIVSWETDEIALCQVFYAQGLISVEDDSESLERETNPVSSHVNVFVGFAPSTVYRFWVVCDDIAGNRSQSEDFVLFTPEKEKSIIDIIIENFEGTFGWLKNIGK